jgi:hypothetical protein
MGDGTAQQKAKTDGAPRSIFNVLESTTAQQQQTTVGCSQPIVGFNDITPTTMDAQSKSAALSWSKLVALVVPSSSIALLLTSVSESAVSGRSLDVVRDWDTRTEVGTAMVFGKWEMDSGGQLLGT